MLHVNVANGEVCYSTIDFSLPGFIRFEFERAYKSNLNKNGVFGWNWNHPLDTQLVKKGDHFLYRNQSGAEIKITPTHNDNPDLLGLNNDNTFKLFYEKDNLILHTPILQKYYFSLSELHTSNVIKPSHVEDINGNVISFKYDNRFLLRSIEDTLGRLIIVSHNKRGKITEFQLVLGKSHRYIRLARYFYDDDDNLVIFQDGLGHSCQFEYVDHLIVRYTNKLGGSFYAQYDHQRRCINVWGDAGIKHRVISYDDKTKATKVTNSLANTTVYKTNDAGLVTNEINPLGEIKKNLFDTNNALLASLDEHGQAKLTTTYDSESRTLSVIDSAGAATVFKDNERGQLINKTDANGSIWTWHYDSKGNLIRIVRPSGAESLYEYDDRGFLIKLTNSNGNIIQQSMTSNGKNIKIQDKLGAIMKYEYDDLGNLTAAIDGNGARSGMQRDVMGRICERSWPDGFKIFYKYNAEGNLTKQINELGNETHLEFDKFGKCVRSIGSLGNIMHYEYDLEQNPTVIVNENGEIHRFEYDTLERVTKQIFFDGSEEQYKYDEIGNIVEIIDGEGKVTQITYNEVQNIVKKVYSDGTFEKFEYDGLRRLIDLENNCISIHLEWDNAGNLIQESQGDRIINYIYNSAGNLIELRDSDGRLIKYEYDLRGRLININDNVTGFYKFGYNNSNFLIRTEFPNSAVLHNEYDKRNRLTRQQISMFNGRLVKLYKFDPADRLIETVDNYVSKNSYKKYFGYDAIERLTSVRNDNNDLLEEYKYDLVGNILYSSDIGHLNYMKGNLFISSKQDRREYNRCGSTTRVQNAKGEYNYKYNGDGKLVRISLGEKPVVEFAYDPFGRRIMKKHNGDVTNYVWNGFTLLEETRLKKNVYYLFDTQRWLPLAQAHDNRIDYFITDRRGCVFAIMDEKAKIKDLFEYNAFGRLQEKSKNSKYRHPFRLRGQYYDKETDIHYNLHRYYEPLTGRFLTRDPLGIDVGLNLYRNGPNPITWEDPFGLSECQGDVFYRAMSDVEKQKVMEDCQLQAREKKCPEGPYVTQNKKYCDAAMSEKPNKYQNLVEICTKPGTADSMTSSPYACRNGSQAQYFPNLPDVVSGNPDRIEHKMERGGLNYGLSKGKGLSHFNNKVESMKIVGTNETCTPNS